MTFSEIIQCTFAPTIIFFFPKRRDCDNENLNTKQILDQFVHIKIRVTQWKKKAQFHGFLTFEYIMCCYLLALSNFYSNPLVLHKTLC